MVIVHDGMFTAFKLLYSLVIHMLCAGQLVSTILSILVVVTSFKTTNAFQRNLIRQTSKFLCYLWVRRALSHSEESLLLSLPP